VSKSAIRSMRRRAAIVVESDICLLSPETKPGNPGNRVPDHNLVMGDRMSMACSLEVRSPFVEFAASLPADMKLRGRKLKYLLRRVARRYLPPEIVRRPKQGFGFPVGLWMRRDLKALVEERLGNSRLVAAGVFRPEPIARIIREHMEGQVDHSYRLWLLLNLEIWHEIYI
jgi:asparagine synthase (glutamine-hydrolysing)